MTETQTGQVQVPGFKLRGKFYPDVGTERLSDGPLLELVCGITSHEWRRRYIEQLERAVDDPAAVDAAPDEVVALGTIAMAISREHPKWSRSQIAEFINTIDWEELEIVRPLEAAESPPADGATGETTTSQSSETSKSGSGSASDPSETPPSSGASTSPTSVVAQ